MRVRKKCKVVIFRITQLYIYIIYISYIIIIITLFLRVIMGRYKLQILLKTLHYYRILPSAYFYKLLFCKVFIRAAVDNRTSF